MPANDGSPDSAEAEQRDRPTPEGRDAGHNSDSGDHSHDDRSDDESEGTGADHDSKDSSANDDSANGDSANGDSANGDDRDADGRPPADVDDINRMEDVDTDVPEENLVDRDKVDFDVDAGLLSGTAIHGGTDIPGEHEMVDDNPEVGEEDDDSDSDDSDSDDSKADQDRAERQGQDTQHEDAPPKKEPKDDDN